MVTPPNISDETTLANEIEGYVTNRNLSQSSTTSSFTSHLVTLRSPEIQTAGDRLLSQRCLNTAETSVTYNEFTGLIIFEF